MISSVILMPWWWTLLGITPLIFSSIASIFSASAQRRAAQEAMNILNQARQEGTAEARRLSEQFDPFIGDARTRLGTSFDVTQRLLGVAEAGAQEGLTIADRLALEDAQRILNENLVSTGNLRSGTAAFQGAELGRRVLADASTRRLNYLQLAFGGAQGLGNIAGTTGQLGLGGKGLATTLLQAAMGLAPAQGSAALARGAAEAAGIQAFGGIGDTLLGAGIGAGFGIPGLSASSPFASTFGGGALGGLLGTQGIGQLALLQTIFGQGAGGGGGQTFQFLPTGSNFGIRAQ